ncbi:MAG: nucleotide sugar dehydrogenase [Firmicutes bacterium]|nr:nucleotide sugar dehydrogenase [Bacillota bacterium]
MNICVIGLGYIGLPTAAMFAAHGHQVLGVDKNADIVEALNQGNVIIEEPGLEDFVKQVVNSGRLKASTALQPADVFIISVPTPITADKKSDMSYVEAATRETVPFLREGNLVVLESTSPVGTVDELMAPILAESGLAIGSQLFLGHSPERVIPGQILFELVHNSRIAGGINRESAQRIADLYKCFVEGDIFLTDSRTAELAKLTENTFRDVNIALANELAKICENLGINVWELIELCNKHPRVNIHQPGPGVGGHCIAVDPWFIVEKQPETALLIHQARLINDSMPGYVLQRIKELLAGIEKPKVAVLGVTYKPDVDDIRESPVLKLVQMLHDNGIETGIHDPFAKGYDSSLEDAVRDADLLLLGVHHKQYRELPAEQLAQIMRHPVLLDTRNFTDVTAFAKAGFACHLLGMRD